MAFGEMRAFVLRQGSWLCLKRSWRGHLVDTDTDTDQRKDVTLLNFHIYI